MLGIVLFEDDSHIFGSNFGDLLDGRKEAEGFRVASRGIDKAGVIVNRGRSRKASLKYIVCCRARLWPILHDLLVCLILYFWVGFQQCERPSERMRCFRVRRVRLI